MMGCPEKPHHQMTDAAFWVLEDDVSSTRPIDDRAVYGSLVLGDRTDDFDYPHRYGPRDLVTAIRTAGEGDRVRVNDKNWMEVLGKEDEGFIARYERGSVKYAVFPRNGLRTPPGTMNLPWMRRYDDMSSAGEVCCLEVDWMERPID